MKRYKICYGENNTYNTKAENLEEAKKKADELKLDYYEIWEEEDYFEGSYSLVWWLDTVL